MEDQKGEDREFSEIVDSNSERALEHVLEANEGEQQKAPSRLKNIRSSMRERLMRSYDVYRYDDSCHQHDHVRKNASKDSGVNLAQIVLLLDGVGVSSVHVQSVLHAMYLLCLEGR